MANDLVLNASEEVLNCANMLASLSADAPLTPRLLPSEKLPAVIDYLEAALVSIGRPRAEFWVRAVISSYPKLPEAFMPEGYILAISSVLAELPEDLARKTVDQVTRKFKFLPSRSEVAEIAEQFLKERRSALSRARRIQRALEEQQAEDRRFAQIQREKEEFFANGGKEKIAEWKADFAARFATTRKEKEEENV